jgi:transcription elongation factor Elf1
VAKITRERAERIAKAHACPHCQEYNFRKLNVKVASKAITEELGVTWIAVKLCGVCGTQSEIGIQDDGDIGFES